MNTNGKSFADADRSGDNCAPAAHDASRLLVTKNVKYTENGVCLNLTNVFWQTASARPTYREDVIDEEAGTVGLIGIINANGNKNFFAARLKVEKGTHIMVWNPAGNTKAPRGVTGMRSAHKPQGRVFFHRHIRSSNNVPVIERNLLCNSAGATDIRARPKSLR